MPAGRCWACSGTRGLPVIDGGKVKAAAKQAAAERAYQSNAKVINDLARQPATFGDERQQLIDQALERLSGGGGDAQRAEVEQLANALSDERQVRHRPEVMIRRLPRDRPHPARR